MKIDVLEPIRYRLIAAPALPPPPIALGSLIFDSSTGIMNYWNGTAWIPLGGNSSVPAPFNVLSYGADPTAVADSAPAFQAAINACIAAGGNRVIIPAGQYRLLSPLDVTAPGAPPSESITFQGDGTRSTLLSIIHNGHAFDCTGRSFCKFADFTVSGNDVIIPQTAFLLARNVTASSAGTHVFNRVTATGFFSVAVIYNYASEDMTTFDCEFANNFVGGKVVVITRNNIFGLASTFAVIAAGGQSTTEIGFLRTQLNHPAAGVGANDCLYLEGASSVYFSDSFIFAANGRAGVYLDNSVSATSNLSFINCMLDGAIQYGWFLHGALSSSLITILNINDAVTTTAIFSAEVGSTILQMLLKNVSGGGSNAVVVDEIDFSEISTKFIDLHIRFAFSGNDIITHTAHSTFDRPDLATFNRIYYVDTGRFSNLRDGSLIWDPANMADGTGLTSPDIAVTGAAFGMNVTVAAPYDLQGIIATAYVQAADVVKIRLQNETGGAIDLGNGTWQVKCLY